MREQAKKINKSILKYSAELDITCAMLTSGLLQDKIKQEDMLRKKPDIVVATPSRVWEFLNRKKMRLDKLEFCVVCAGHRVIQLCHEPLRGVLHHLNGRKCLTVVCTSQLTPELSSFVKKHLDKNKKVVQIAEEVLNPSLGPQTSNEHLNLSVLNNTVKLQKALSTKHQLVGSLHTLCKRLETMVQKASMA